MKKWYVVHTKSGYEKKAQSNLLQRIDKLGMQDKIFDVKIPTETVVDRDSGKMLEKNLYPGYILVQMEFNEDSWYVVRNTEGVTGFVGSRQAAHQKPTALTRDEFMRIMRLTKDSDKPISVTEFEVGQTVRIKEGAFADYDATIKEVNADKAKLLCTVILFGRETPVEFEFGAVEVIR